jgi:hypothetical protein
MVLDILASFSIAPMLMASTLYNGWNYAIDSFNDGIESNQIGPTSAFEFYGVAYRQVGERLDFAFNSNLDWDQAFPSPGARNNNIAYGDFFLNFQGTTFAAANATSSLYAIHFDRDNDTQIAGQPPALGLYRNVQAEGLTTVNNGFATLNAYEQKIRELGGSPNYADLPAGTDYLTFNAGALTHMKSGELVSPIAIQTNFAGTGLDFGHFSATGSKTFGFSLDSRLLPVGSFMANVFAECSNDGIAIAGQVVEPKEAPEPTGWLAMVVGAIGLGAGRRRLN